MFYIEVYVVALEPFMHIISLFCTCLVEDWKPPEAIHVMFYIEVYVVALEPFMHIISLFCTCLVEVVEVPKSGENPGNLLCPMHAYISELPSLLKEMPLDGEYHLAAKKM